MRAPRVPGAPAPYRWGKGAACAIAAAGVSSTTGLRTAISAPTCRSGDGCGEPVARARWLGGRCKDLIACNALQRN